MQQSVMWVLTGLTLMRRLALLDKMSTAQTIQAEIIPFQTRKPLIMRHQLEFRASIHRVSISSAEDTVFVGRIGVYSERSNSLTESR